MISWRKKTPTVSGSGLLSYCIPSLLQWQSATSVERKACCFPYLLKHRHNGLLMLRGSVTVCTVTPRQVLHSIGECCDHPAVSNDQCGKREFFWKSSFYFLLFLIKLNKFWIVLDLVSWEDCSFWTQILFTVFMCGNGVTTEPSLKRCIFKPQWQD